MKCPVEINWKVCDHKENPGTPGMKPITHYLWLSNDKRCESGQTYSCSVGGRSTMGFGTRKCGCSAQRAIGFGWL